MEMIQISDQVSLQGWEEAALALSLVMDRGSVAVVAMKVIATQSFDLLYIFKNTFIVSLNRGILK